MGFVVCFAIFFCVFPITSDAKVVFITSGTTWTVPADWTNVNTIECIGGGAGGAINAGSDYGAGGGGGAYSKKNNLTGLTPGGTVTIQIGSGGSPNTSGSDTWFNGASLGASSCGAEGGKAPTNLNKTGGLGGSSASGVGDTKYSGGNGGNAGGGGETGGAGGGGAAGPNGDGARGGNLMTGGSIGTGSGAANGGSQGVDQTVLFPTDGGNNRNGTGGGAAGSGSAGVQGTNGGGSGGGASGYRGADGSQDSIWSQTSDNSLAGPGSGGGGNGNNANLAAGNGALYGGGGGGGAFNGTNQNGGTGGQGIIVVTYTPTSTPSPSNMVRATNNLGLMGYWPLNELTNGNAITLDYSGNHNDFMLSGPTLVTGKVGKALNFGSSFAQYGLTTLNGTSLTQTSVSFWVKPTVLPSGQSGMFQWASTIGDGSPFILIAYNSSGFITIYVDGGYQITTGLPLQSWSHIALTLDVGNLWHLYINGVEVGTYQDDGTHSNQSNAIRAYIGNGYSAYFDGVIDELRIYNRALSLSEITNIYKSSAAAHKSSSNLGLVGYWSFNDGSGSAAADYSGNHRDGVLTTDGNGIPLWGSGKAGSGLVFSSAGQKYVTVPDNLIRGTIGTSGSLSMWFKTTTYGPLFSYNTANLSEYVPILYVGTDGLLYGEVWMGTVSPMISSRVVNDGNWHLATLAWSGSSQSLYLDGVLATSPLSGSVNHLTMNINTIGKAYTVGWANGGSGTVYFTGSIDEVRAYNRTLSSDEVLSLYNSSGKAITVNSTRTELVKTSLIGYWPFDGKYVNWATGKVLDVSGAGHDGIIQSLSTSTSPRMGKVGQALSFRGADGNDFIALSSLGVDTNAGARNTVAFWMYWTPLNESSDFFSMPFGFDTYDLAFNKVGSNRYFGFNTGNGDLLGIPDYSSLVGKWVHVVGIFYNGTPDITNNEIWINGEKQTIAVQVPGQTSKTVSTYATISGWPPSSGYAFRGMLDDVRIYNRALTASEITKLYNATK